MLRVKLLHIKGFYDCLAAVSYPNHGKCVITSSGFMLANTLGGGGGGEWRA